MIGDYIRFTLGNFRHRKMRTFLTVLGIFIGIAAVITLVSLAQGFEEAVNEQFASMGESKILIMPGSGVTSYMGLAPKELTDRDIDLIASVSGVKKVAGMITKMARVEVNGIVTYPFVAGVPADWNILTMYSGVEIERGRYFRSTDRYKAGLGWGYTDENSISKPVKPGDKIKINNYTVEVIGTISKIGNPADDSNVYLPMDTAREILETPTGYYMLLAEVHEGYDTGKVAEEIKAKIRKDRGLKPGEENFDVQTMEDLRKIYTALISTIEFVVIGIAAISLIVGGIGIMNSIYTSVIERTREVGVMKAIGARNSEIMMLFLVEAGMLGLVGGALGIATGLAVSKLIELYAVSINVSLLKVTIQPMVVFGALVFSLLVGVISGVLPALNAANLRPIEALRYE